MVATCLPPHVKGFFALGTPKEKRSYIYTFFSRTIGDIVFDLSSARFVLDFEAVFEACFGRAAIIQENSERDFVTGDTITGFVFLSPVF